MPKIKPCWVWEKVAEVGFVTEHTLKGPDVLCRYWHNEPPSNDAKLIGMSLNIKTTLEKVKEACLFADDGGYIGVTSEPHISEELFAEICEVLNMTETKDGESNG